MAKKHHSPRRGRAPKAPSTRLITTEPNQGAWQNRILCHTSEDLSALPDDVIALTVTSPPYWNAIDYDRHSEDPNQWYRTRRYSLGYSDYEEYLTWLSKIMKGILQKTRPGGFCAIIIGTVLLNGRHFPVPFDVTHRLCSQGWEFHQDIIWHKVTAGVKRAGVVIQKPFPGYYYPNIMTEYILIYRRPGDPIYRNRDPEHRKRAKIPINRLFTNELANNVWHIAPVPPGYLNHPCPFPEEIPYRLINLYTYPGDVVFDPFAGSGQTLKVAKQLGRVFVGYDINPKYVKYTLQRVDEPLSVREEQLVAIFDKIPLNAERPTADRANGGKTRYARKDMVASHSPQPTLFD